MLESTVGAVLDKAFKKYKDHFAFKIGGQEYSYGQVGKSVEKLAQAFMSLGLKKGDRIVIMTINSIEYLYADYAAAKAGLVIVPLNVMLTEKDIDYRIRDAEARAVLLDEFFYKKVGLFFKKYDFVKSIICVTENKEILSQGVISFRSLLETGSSAIPYPDIVQEDLRAIMYTGGTTGEPKGVMHTHKSYLSIVYSEIVEFDIRDGEVMIQTAPLPHAAGFLIPPCLLRGGRVIVTNGFDPEEFCKLVQQEKATWTFMVPTMIYAVLDHQKRTHYDLSSLRTICYGAAPISPRRLEEAMNMMGPVFHQGYSQMEVANQTAVFTKRQHVEAVEKGKLNRLKSTGMPIIMSQFRIVDENDRDVEKGKSGEIITRGPHMMKGYWRKPKETDEAIVNGWLHTGDLAYEDEDGYIYLVDRKHDMIISGGMNIYSAEVESVLAQHPAVAETIVIGIPDEKWGELVQGIVVKTPGKDVSEAELLEYCKIHLTAYKRPKRIEFYDAIPRTAYGKMDKKAVRKKYWEGQERMI